jgi:hypothetical protein
VTNTAVWLAWQELAARGKRVALAGAVVATIAAAVTATEFVAQGREAEVAAQIDAMGPALTIVPRGTTASGLARYEIEGVVPPRTEELVRRALGDRLRAFDRRVVVHREIAGARRPVVGVEAFVGVDTAIPATDVASVGSELGRAFPVGARLAIGGRTFPVERILPSTGSVEDVSVLLPIEDVRGLGGTDRVNELRIFLAAGVSVRDAEARLVRAVPGVTVIRTDRGEVADRSLQESLARHRTVAYAILAVVAVLTLLIAAHLDATERRLELATLVAIGASTRTILGVLLARSAVVGGVGSAVGVLIGVAIALAVRATPQALGPGGGALSLGVVVAGVSTGLVAAAPTALATVTRDPVRELQEG